MKQKKRELTLSKICLVVYFVVISSVILTGCSPKVIPKECLFYEPVLTTLGDTPEEILEELDKLKLKENTEQTIRMNDTLYLKEC